MPPNVISASVLVCEKVLTEQDGVMSAIRIADVFYIPEMPEQPQGSMAIVQAYALIILKSKPGEESEHTLALKLERPDGTLVNVTDKPEVVALKSKLPGAPGGVNMIAILNLQPKTMGTYMLRAYVDSEEVGSAPITLLRTVGKSVN
jgi:hypothetical protein